MRSNAFLQPVCLLLAAALQFGTAAAADPLDAARKRWADSPHGPMLERILPPGFEPAMLPEPESAGARLAMRYCVQCHNLANPAMHHAAKWPPIVDRMVLRMRGRGNMGKLMAEMMAGVEAPDDADAKLLVDYLRRHAQRPLDPRKYPDLNSPGGEQFRLACQQCHVLPDPQRHTAKEWPAVVARMEKNMEWMNRVVGSRPARGEPQLRVEDINAFLARHARREPGMPR
jgi:mono/diheme cytochrome c family protein